MNRARWASGSVWVVFAILFVLHHDFWNWEDNTVVFGFLPIGLAYHVGFSLVVALLWAVALKVAWPARWESWAEEGEAEEVS